jgi:hypothetical protein
VAGEVKTYSSGRVCVHEGCCTRLSIYNPLRKCSVHYRAPRPSPPKAREREVFVRTCAHKPCGRQFSTTNPARRFCSDACRMRAFQERRKAAALQVAQRMDGTADLTAAG